MALKGRPPVSWKMECAELVPWAQQYTGPKFHAVLCDPPYGLRFLGKSWDVISAKEWGEALRPHLLPGALVLMFSGTRTWHKLATGMEDAGFEIWDTFMWLYGSGFPKAQDVSKLIDKKNGDQREVIEQVRVKGGGTEHMNRTNAEQDYRPGDYQKGENVLDVTAPGSELSAPWAGHKTPAVKPAWEPIIAFRAPSGGKTYAELALEHGTGSLNIDGERIGTDQGGWGGNPSTGYSGSLDNKQEARPVEGRFPANLLLDEVSAAALDQQEAGVSRFFYVSKASPAERDKGLYGFEMASSKKRNARDVEGSVWQRNPHPTVKPVDLIRHLAALLLPPASVSPRRLLIPFAGSGSEVIGAIRAGWDEVYGVERDPEYVRVARARIEGDCPLFNSIEVMA
jgi:16S rRNA G966 N2-methylase RsmD